MVICTNECPTKMITTTTIQLKEAIEEGAGRQQTFLKYSASEAVRWQRLQQHPVARAKLFCLFLFLSKLGRSTACCLWLQLRRNKVLAAAKFMPATCHI